METIWKGSIAKKAVSKKNKMIITARKRLIKSFDVVEFEKTLKAAFSSTYTGAPVGHPVSLEVEIWWKDARRRDLQNALDTICDSMQGILIKDDSQIVEISATKIIKAPIDLINISLYKWEK